MVELKKKSGGSQSWIGTLGIVASRILDIRNFYQEVKEHAMLGSLSEMKEE